MATKRVRILVPYQAPHIDISGGDVVEIDAAEADALVTSGAAEVVRGDTKGTTGGGATPRPEPLEVGSGPYKAPKAAKEQLDAGEGGNTPRFEPLPVGSGPYEPPEAAVEQLEVGEGGHTPPFQPLPVAPESETITPTDEQGQPKYDISEETEDVEPKLSYADWKMPDLRAAVKDRGLKPKGTKKAALVKALEEADG